MVLSATRWFRQPSRLVIAVLVSVPVFVLLPAAVGGQGYDRPSSTGAPNDSTGAEEPPHTGWKRFQFDSDRSYVDVYVPFGVDLTLRPPAIMFLHGSGNFPIRYRPLVQGSANALGVVLALPRSAQDQGWGFGGDIQTVAHSVQVLERLGVDTTRMGVSGHSAGGAYAYLLAYLADFGFSGVFTLGAPSQPVSGLRDGAYVAPIRMVYGTEDPNYRGGALDRLISQWEELGVPWESDLLVGFGHNEWPESAMTEGYEFLLAQQYVEGGPSDPGTPGTPDPPDPPSGLGCDGQSETELCLRDGRFAVEVTWTRPNSLGSGPGRVLPFSTEDSGIFYFFREANWELMVKVLNGCALNDHYWVYAAGTTNLQYELRVTDRFAQRTVAYENPPATASPAVTDSQALPTCP